MPVLTVAIGNSDDKLSQQDWAGYWDEVDQLVRAHASQVHGAFLSLPNARWQNACWVFECDRTDSLCALLARTADRFGQDSIAVTMGETVLVRPAEREEAAG